MVFHFRQKKRIWTVNGHSLEKVSYSMYLQCMVLQCTGAKNAHLEHAASHSERTVNVILKFSHTEKGLYVSVKDSCTLIGPSSALRGSSPNFSKQLYRS